MLARPLVDLQTLSDAFSKICSHLHEQIALDKTEAVLFAGPSDAQHFLLQDGVLYKRLSKRVVDAFELVFQNQPVKWFLFLGSPIFGTEFLEDSVLATVRKDYGSLRSACNFAVGIPVPRVVGLHQALVNSIALLNGAAWAVSEKGQSLVFRDM